MTAEFQNIVALAIVLMATAYLVRRGWRSIAKKRSGGCGACGNCPAGGDRSLAKSFGGADPAGKPLVQLDMRPKPRSDPMMPHTNPKR